MMADDEEQTQHLRDIIRSARASQDVCLDWIALWRRQLREDKAREAAAMIELSGGNDDG